MFHSTTTHTPNGSHVIIRSSEECQKSEAFNPKLPYQRSFDGFINCDNMMNFQDDGFLSRKGMINIQHGGIIGKNGMKVFQGINLPNRIRIVGVVNEKTSGILGVVHAKATGFHVNLCDAKGEILFHFNPRFKENCIVLNSTKDGGKWQIENRYLGMPLERGKIFTLDLIASEDSEEKETIKMFINGKEVSIKDSFGNYVPFEPRQGDSLYRVKNLEIGGDIQLHSVSICTHNECTGEMAKNRESSDSSESNDSLTPAVSFFNEPQFGNVMDKFEIHNF